MNGNAAPGNQASFAGSITCMEKGSACSFRDGPRYPAQPAVIRGYSWSENHLAGLLPRRIAEGFKVREQCPVVLT
jgi:hypothetical protein